MERLNPKTLPEDVQEVLENITHKEPTGLTLDERNFLRARAMYLRPEQFEVFSSVLSSPVEREEAVEVEKTVSSDAVTVEDEIKQINPDKFTKNVLIQMAKDASLDVSDSMTKAQIGELINSHLRGE